MSNNEKAEIDLMKNGVYIIINGHIINVTPKQYGEDRIIWQDGKVLDVIRSERHRLNEQDKI